ncbi:hypothetical protein H0H81_010952 [Sphagnurus paluster]|uniref:Uncharacterized protein n=1 Tax=Sphagnurus paluster TaxID=117069 RepID=A0A9P7FNW8_9AGAR|nr:hypothetical protein H0H81_010952 [Sphagnurus paluster]
MPPSYAQPIRRTAGLHMVNTSIAQDGFERSQVVLPLTLMSYHDHPVLTITNPESSAVLADGSLSTAAFPGPLIAAPMVSFLLSGILRRPLVDPSDVAIALNNDVVSNYPTEEYKYTHRDRRDVPPTVPVLSPEPSTRNPSRFQIFKSRRHPPLSSIFIFKGPKMANLDDLPPEIRSRIVDFAMKPYIIDYRYATEREKFSFACSLSLVSRAMNDTAGPYIFRKYRLDIRQKVSDWGMAVYPPKSERLRWNEDVIAQRLAHLRSKAQHVRVIVLKDYGPEQHNKEAAENEPPPFPPQLMPSLMAALRTLRYVTGVSLITASFDSDRLVSLPRELWDWIHAVRPLEFAVRGDFDITSADLTPPLESVTTLAVERFSFARQQLLIDVRLHRSQIWTAVAVA